MSCATQCPTTLLKDQVLIFFYIDDIVFTFLIERSQLIKVIITKLKKHYNLTSGKNLQWFLGIEIIQDQYKGYVTLTQRVHLSQFRKDYSINTNLITLIMQKELLPYKGTAINLKIKKY